MNEPTVTARLESTDRVLTFRYTVEGAEDRPMPYSRSGKTFRPQRVIVTLRPVAGDREYREVSITGPRVLKSGEPGQESATERWYGNEAHGRGILPEWVADIVNTAVDDAINHGWL